MFSKELETIDHIQNQATIKKDFIFRQLLVDITGSSVERELLNQIGSGMLHRKLNNAELTLSQGPSWACWEVFKEMKGFLLFEVEKVPFTL